VRDLLRDITDDIRQELLRGQSAESELIASTEATQAPNYGLLTLDYLIVEIERRLDARAG
jgi:hypothetical protein